MVKGYLATVMLVAALGESAAACDLPSCKSKWIDLGYSQVLSPKSSIEDDDTLKAAKSLQSFKGECDCYISSDKSVGPKLDAALVGLQERIVAYEAKSKDASKAATEKYGADVAPVAMKLNPEDARDFQTAFDEIKSGDLFKGMASTNSFCQKAYADPSLTGPCKQLGQTIKPKLGNIDPRDVPHDAGELNVAMLNIETLSGAKNAKNVVDKLKGKYGMIKPLVAAQKKLDGILPGLERRHQEKTAQMQAQKAADVARAAELKNKRETEAAARATKDNSPQCKSARKKDEYCRNLLVAERYQIILDEENEVVAASGTVKPGVMNNLTRNKLSQEKAARFLASEFKDITGASLTPADCKIKRKPGKLRDEAVLEDAVATSLRSAIIQHCGTPTDPL